MPPSHAPLAHTHTAHLMHALQGISIATVLAAESPQPSQVQAVLLHQARTTGNITTALLANNCSGTAASQAAAQPSLTTTRLRMLWAHAVRLRACRWLATFSRDIPSTSIIARMLFGTAFFRPCTPKAARGAAAGVRAGGLVVAVTGQSRSLAATQHQLPCQPYARPQRYRYLPDG